MEEAPSEEKVDVADTIKELGLPLVEEKVDNTIEFPTRLLPPEPVHIPISPDSPKDGVDPVIDPADLALINKAKSSLEVLRIESKTIIGFVSEHLVARYGVKNQEQFDRLFGTFN